VLLFQVEQASRNQDIRLRPVIHHFPIDTESSQFLQPSILLHQASENKGNQTSEFLLLSMISDSFQHAVVISFALLTCSPALLLWYSLLSLSGLLLDTIHIMNLRVTFNRIAAIAALASPSLFAPGAVLAQGVDASEQDVTPAGVDASEQDVTPTVLQPFDYIGKGGCLAAGGGKAQEVDWNRMPRNKRKPEDCARLCLTEEQNALYGFFGFDIGYGKCRCFYAASTNSPYPVRLGTNGGYRCYAFDLPGLCEMGLP
jgi:hypothetical protein